MKKPLVSIIIPCLNEEGAIGKCVREARSIKFVKFIKFVKSEGLKPKIEIIVVDNGSTDKSREVAKKAGAKVIIEPRKGYGRALLTGMEKAKGEILVFADGDGSYDFREVPKLLEALMGPVAKRLISGLLRRQKPAQYKAGRLLVNQPSRFAPPINDLVIGSRLMGKIEKGAMPFWHHYFGTPLLNWLFFLFFKQKISDVNSGFRAITKSSFDKLKIYSTGMEFASEMLYKAAKKNLKITEVPITYRKRVGKSKLSPFRDAWRHIKFMLLFSPTYLFVLPGVILGILGLLGMLWLLPEKQLLLGRFFDIHTMTVCSFLLLIGFQLVFLGLFAKVFSVNFLQEEDAKTTRLMKIFTLEKGVALGIAVGIIGVIGMIWVIGEWWKNSFGSLSQERILLFSLTFITLGLEVIFSSFFFGILGREER